jgi:hypothetical protein
MKPAHQTSEPEKKPTSTAYIPYINNTYGCLSRMLAKYNIIFLYGLTKQENNKLSATSQGCYRFKNNREYTGSHVIVVRSTLDRVVSSSTYALWSMIDT